ncbi:glycosyltransferase [Amnibacterium setariae]|uniref:Glycosyltransferase family 2 protein n=1 Tax=Amnibacterium setariae TaxID=2306585 RepID=A0A3A1TSD8_9MICO|nr:glycosyltransferase family 2 protein [Amnibacterium setariae]RIX26615.1 glycosyltransferase family 2 protein [Amnibacterium setariae]
MRITVVVVNYGASDLLEETLAPLVRSDPSLRAVVVDNRSTERERLRLSALAAEEGWATVLPDANLGFGAGMNLGVAAAFEDGAEAVLLLNPDAAIDRRAVRLLGETVRADPMALAAPRIERPDGSLWSVGHLLDLRDGTMRSARRGAPGADAQQWLTGACLLMHRRLWDAAGGFADDYFLYWEDVDLSARVLAAGGRLVVVDDAVAVHAEGGTQGNGIRTAGTAKSPTYYYWNVRNRQVFAALHLDEQGRRRWRREDRRVLLEVVLQGGRRQLLTAPHRSLLPALRGLRDGRRVARTLRRTA